MTIARISPHESMLVPGHGTVNVLLQARRRDDRRDDPRDRASRDVAGSDEHAAFAALLHDLLVPRALRDEIREESAEEYRRVELDREVHPEGEGERRHADERENHRDDDAEGEENPLDPRSAPHEPDDDLVHRRGLRRRHLLRAELVRAPEEHHREGARRRRDEHADELERLLVARRRADPVADLEIGREGAGHGERRADDAPDDERHEHPVLAGEPHSREHDARDDERDERHSRHGIRADEPDGARGDEREEERNDERDRDADETDGRSGEAGPEEYEETHGDGDDAEEHVPHAEVAVGPGDRPLPLARRRDPLDPDAERLHDRREAPDDPHDAGPRDAADADEPHVVREDVVDSHLRDRHSPRRNDAREMGPDVVHDGDEDEVREEAPRRDNRGVLEPDDVAEPDDRGEPVDAECHREPVLNLSLMVDHLL